MNVIAFVQANWGVIASGLFFISEALALIPSIKANSIFQLIFPILQKGAQDSTKPTDTPK